MLRLLNLIVRNSCPGEINKRLAIFVVVRFCSSHGIIAHKLLLFFFWFSLLHVFPPPHPTIDGGQQTNESSGSLYRLILLCCDSIIVYPPLIFERTIRKFKRDSCSSPSFLLAPRLRKSSEMPRFNPVGSRIHSLGSIPWLCKTYLQVLEK